MRGRQNCPRANDGATTVGEYTINLHKKTLALMI